MGSRNNGIGGEAPIIVVGAGAVGLLAAMGLARRGRFVVLVGRAPPPRPGRTVALFDEALALVRDAGAWPLLAETAAPLATMRIVDATSSLFRPPPVVFRAEEIGRPRFGFNVPNDALEAALRQVAGTLPTLQVRAATAVDATFSSTSAAVTLDGGETVRGALVVAADGRRSRMRQAARIGVRETVHPQQALTAILAHPEPHGGISTEFHTRQGPFTLVPLPDGVDGGGRSSLVWVMSPLEAERRIRLAPAALEAEIERQCGRLLGPMSLASTVGRFPIVTSIAARVIGERMVLIGEAAHALPPIGAQGLNLSLRDVAMLLEHLGRAGAVADALTLRRYARARAADIGTRALGVGLLNGALLSRNGGVDLLRGVGLAALSRSGRLRRLAMRQGLTSASTAARLP